MNNYTLCGNGKVTIIIPEDLQFSDLQLSRDPITMEIEFDLGCIEKICESSGIPVEMFTHSDEGNVAGLIVCWYRQHCQVGGATDPVAEQLIAEVNAEDAGYNVQSVTRVQ